MRGEDIQERGIRIAAACRDAGMAEASKLDGAAHFELGIRILKAHGFSMHDLLERLPIAYLNAATAAEMQALAARSAIDTSGETS
jgi:hypothetical protein